MLAAALLALLAAAGVFLVAPPSAPRPLGLTASSPLGLATASGSVWKRRGGGGGASSFLRAGSPVPPLPTSLSLSKPSPSSASSVERRLRCLALARPPRRGPPESEKRKVFFGNGFHSDDIRHPLDLRYTQLLQRLPGINAVIGSLAGSVAEQVLGLDNVGRGVLVGPTQAPKIYEMLNESCEILQMEVPSLYIRQNPNPNAYTLAISGKQPFIVLHTSLVELLTEKELQAVIAHELGHLKCDHGIWLTAANVFSMGFSRLLPIPFFADTIEDTLMRWIRSAELTCDRAAMLVAQDPTVVISALMKLAGGCKALEGQLNVEAFLEQARAYEEASSTPIGWYLQNAESKSLSHPLPVMRAREIDQWARSPEYRKLVNPENQN